MIEVIGQSTIKWIKIYIPHFYVTMECLMDSLIKIREECNMDEDNKISINDFIIKACAYALRDTPVIIIYIIPSKMNQYTVKYVCVC